MKKISLFCLTLFTFLFSQSQYLKGSLQGNQETTSNAATGSGLVIVNYDSYRKTLQLFGDYASLSDTITGAYIITGSPGVNGSIAVTLTNTGDTTGALSATATLTQEQEDSLLAGNMYVNLYTKTYPAGELRAQLTQTNTYKRTFLSGRLQGAQEVPSDTSKAIGSVYALVDAGTDSIFITGHYNHLITASDAAQVLLGSPGTVGTGLFPLYQSFATSGAIHAAAAISAANAAIISTGHAYVNVNSSSYPSGEIRAQLNNYNGSSYYGGEMKGSNEVPPNSSAARGIVIMSITPSMNGDLYYVKAVGDYQNLSDTVTYAQIDGLYKPFINTRDSTGTITVTDTLTIMTVLSLAETTVNVHSAAFPNGEISAKLIPTTNFKAQIYTPLLEGIQEVPSNSSTATGTATVIVDTTTGLTYVTGSFRGVNSPVFRAELDRGAFGDTGSVILPLNAANVSSSKSGTFSGSGTLSATLVDSMINGFTYINIYSQNFPNGVIRGQLTDIVILPLKLIYFNAVKKDDKVQLIWETAEELNVSRYEIQQFNTTTKSWITKGTVASQNTNNGAKYSYQDIPEFYETHYVIYRLKMIDKNGGTTYSSIIKLNFENPKAELFIQINPVVNAELRFNITGIPTGKKAEVSIIDYNGRLLLKTTTYSLMNNILKIISLPAGVYKLVVRVDNTVLQKSFIK